MFAYLSESYQMPLENLHRGEDYAWALWRLAEEEAHLRKLVPGIEPIPNHITNAQKRLEFIGARVLVAELLKQWGHDFHGLIKDEFGKPYPKGYPYQISLSHSYPYVAAILQKDRPAGIDLEQPKPKLLRVAPRVLHAEELKDAGDDVIKHCIYWSAKESLVKIHGKKDLVFAENIRISPFSREKHGFLIGRLIVDTQETAIPLQYFVEANFVVVLNRN
ncbi:MAG TPA: 4'-phosphopantetheinyl transferase superfamily protein [Chryseosolibacter sp.]